MRRRQSRPSLLKRWWRSCSGPTDSSPVCAGTPSKAVPQMLTWDLSAALAQGEFRTQQPAAVQRPAGGPAWADDAGITSAAESPMSQTVVAGGSAASNPSPDPSPFADGAAGGTLPRRPSLGSILRAVSLPCSTSADDDPTVSPGVELAINGKAQASCCLQTADPQCHRKVHHRVRPLPLECESAKVAAETPNNSKLYCAPVMSAVAVIEIRLNSWCRWAHVWGADQARYVYAGTCGRRGRPGV